MSEKNLIPELRFPAFEKDGEWTVSSIDKLCDILNNIRKPVTSTNRTAGPYPYYGASGIIDFIDKFLFDERLLLIGEDGAKWGAYDNTAFLVEGKYWVNNHAHVLKPIGIDEKLLESYLVKLDLNPYITGAAPPKLTLRKLKEIPVPVPSTPEEQQKIASCLSSLDELIAAHKDKLDALKDHKKGLLQNLFPQEGETVPKVRFPEFEDDGEWVEKKLNTLSKRVIAKNRNGKFTAVFTNSATAGIVDQRDYFDKDIANKKNLENYFVVQNGDYVYNPRISEHAPVGPLFKNRLGKTGVMSPLYTVFRFNEKNNDFYEYYFQTSHWRNSIRAIANTGARFDRISITASLFMEIPVLYTGLMEQQKIASCLSAVDELITAQQDKIEQLQQHKKGLMQGLFPSAV